MKKEAAENILIEFFARCSWAAGVYENVDIYRHGPDVAAFICDQSVNNSDFFRICQEIIGMVGLYTSEGAGENLLIKSTMGASCYRKGADSVAAAEQALFFAKEMHKEFEFTMTEEIAEKSITTYNDISKQAEIFLLAQKEGRIVPFYQPILNLKTNEVDKFEALARVITLDGEHILPGGFLEGVRNFGMGGLLTEIILSKALKAETDKWISVNISIADMLSLDFRKMILRKLEKTQKKIIFEILESDSERNAHKISSFIHDVKSLGVRIAIDDFGTGHSNFNRLLGEWGVDILKIDGSIVSKILDNKRSRHLLEGISKMAQDLEIMTVGEYVCSADILEAVREIGIDYAQGFHVGKPSPVYAV